jgi:hypothetical protein|tara:strand:+ start:2654 stop:2884 length:231 start_codon:yes stop_codon:yes gene_type:complete
MRDVVEQTSDSLEQRPKLTWGIMAFATIIFVPFVAAIIIYIGAFVVSGDVYAAEDAGQDGDVAGWKHNLVGICPLH